MKISTLLYIFVGGIFFAFSPTPVYCQKIATGLTDENQNRIEVLKIKGNIPIDYQKMIDSSHDIDLSFYLPYVQDQGQIESCTAFAISEAISIRANILNQKKFDQSQNIVNKNNFLYSAQYIWTSTKISFPPPKNTDCTIGINFSEAVTAIYRDGVIDTDRYKYESDNLQSCYKPNQSFEVAKKLADKRSRLTFEVPDRISKENFIYILKRGFPICIAVHLDQYFDKAEHDHLTWDKKGKEGEKHAMVIVGYKADTKCFKVLNSHGKEKGDHGFIWINENLIDPDQAKSVVYQAYVCGLDDQLLNLEKGNGAKNNADINQYSFQEYDEKIDYNAWMKAGYYRIYNNIRFGVSFLNTRSHTVLLQIVDNNKDENGNNPSLCGSQLMKIGDTFSWTSPDSLSFKITLLDIAHRGSPLNFGQWKAAIFAIELFNQNVKLRQQF